MTLKPKTLQQRLRDLTTCLKNHSDHLRHCHTKLQNVKSCEGLKEENETLQDLVDDAERKIEQLTKEHKQELDAWKEKCTKAQQTPYIPPTQSTSVDEKAQAYRDIIHVLVSDTPTGDIETYLKLIGICFDDRVTILPSAFNSAKKAAKFQQPQRALKLMLRLVTHYLDAHISGGDVEAREVFTRNEYSANVSETTKTKRHAIQYYTSTHEGQTHIYEQHLCIGKKQGVRHTWRLYFRIDQHHYRVVIAHCGEHLPT